MCSEEFTGEVSVCQLRKEPLKGKGRRADSGQMTEGPERHTREFGFYPDGISAIWGILKGTRSDLCSRRVRLAPGRLEVVKAIRRQLAGAQWTVMRVRVRPEAAVRTDTHR